MPIPSHAGSDGQAPFAPTSPFPHFTSPIPLPIHFPVSLDPQSLPLTSPLPINHPSHNEASLPLWSPLAPPTIPQVIGGAFNALLHDEDSSDDDDDCPALPPPASPPPLQICFVKPPRGSPARFPTTGTTGASVLSAASPSPCLPLPSRSRMPCMSNSPTELHKHPSGCGQRWGSGGSERKAETEPDSAPDNSPSHPILCRLSAPLTPYAHEPNGGGAGQPSDPSGGGCRGDAVRNPCILTAPNQTSDTTLLVSLSPHIPDSGASHILLRSSSLPELSHLFTPSPVPPISLSQANGDPLIATTGGTITFPFRPPILTYVSSTLAHNLWSVSALIGPDGTAQFTPTSVEFFSPLSPEPFLTGSKREQDTLWSLNIPPPPQTSSCLPSTLALYTPAQVPVIPNTGKIFQLQKNFH